MQASARATRWLPKRATRPRSLCRCVSATPVDSPGVHPRTSARGPQSDAVPGGRAAALEGTGLDDQEQLDVVISVSSFVRGSAHISVGITLTESQSELTGEQLQEAYGRAYARILDPQRFPNTARVLAGDEERAREAEATTSVSRLASSGSSMESHDTSNRRLDRVPDS